MYFSTKRNAKEWTGLGFEFGVIKHCVFCSTSKGLVYESHNFLPRQLVCLAAEYAAQFPFDKYTVKDPRIKPGTLYKNNYGNREVDFFEESESFEVPIKGLWEFLVAYTIRMRIFTALLFFKPS